MYVTASFEHPDGSITPAQLDGGQLPSGCPGITTITGNARSASLAALTSTAPSSRGHPADRARGPVRAGPVSWLAERSGCGSTPS